MTGEEPSRATVRIPERVLQEIAMQAITDVVFNKVEPLERRFNSLAGFVRKASDELLGEVETFQEERAGRDAESKTNIELFEALITSDQKLAADLKEYRKLVADVKSDLQSEKQYTKTKFDKQTSALQAQADKLTTSFVEAVNRIEDVKQDSAARVSQVAQDNQVANDSMKAQADQKLVEIRHDIAAVGRAMDGVTTQVNAHDQKLNAQDQELGDLKVELGRQKHDGDARSLQLRQLDIKKADKKHRHDYAKRAHDHELPSHQHEEMAKSAADVEEHFVFVDDKIKPQKDIDMGAHSIFLEMKGTPKGRFTPKGSIKTVNLRKKLEELESRPSGGGGGGGGAGSVLATEKFVIDDADFDTTSMPNAVDIDDIALTTSLASLANGDIFYYNSGFQRLAKGDDTDLLTLSSGIPAWTAAGGGAPHALDSHNDVDTITEATGDIWYWDGDSWTDLPIGTEDQVLSVSAGGIPEWAAAGSGTVTEAFKTITGITNDVVADEATDTLTLASTDAKLTIVGTTATDTITFTVVEGELDHDALTNFAAGEHFLQSAITETGTIATGVWNGTAIADAYVAGAAGWDAKTDYAFTTITGITNDVVAEAAADTLTLASGGANLTIVGTTATDTITFSVVDAQIDHDALTNFVAAEHVDWAGAAAGTIHTDNYIEGGAGTDTTALHDNVAGEIMAITAKATPVAADEFVIEDSAAANVKKAVTFANIEATLSHDALADFAANEHFTIASQGLDDLKETSLADPGADRVVFWDDSDTAFEFLTLGTGLTITTNDLAFTTKTANFHYPVGMGVPFLDGSNNDVDMEWYWDNTNEHAGVKVTVNNADDDGDWLWEIYLPDDFSSFASDAIKYWMNSSDATNAGLTFSVSDGTDTHTDARVQSATWVQTTITAAELTTDSVASSAGSKLIIRAKADGDVADIVYIGGFDIYYNKA